MQIQIRKEVLQEMSEEERSSNACNVLAMMLKDKSRWEQFKNAESAIDGLADHERRMAEGITAHWNIETNTEPITLKGKDNWIKLHSLPHQQAMPLSMLYNKLRIISGLSERSDDIKPTTLTDVKGLFGISEPTGKYDSTVSADFVWQLKELQKVGKAIQLKTRHDLAKERISKADYKAIADRYNAKEINFEQAVELMEKLVPTIAPPAVEDGELIATNWDDVNGDVEWLWNEKIPLEGITLVAGVGGLGKSTLVIDIAASITTARAFPNGDIAPIGDVVIFSAEDADKVIKARLERQGADLKRVHKLEGTQRNGKVVYFDLSDIDTLTKAMQRWPQTKLIIIDPVASYAGGINSHNTAEVRSVMVPLVKFAEQHHIAVVLIVHFNKDSKGSADMRISGSAAWRDLARNSWQVYKDKNDENRRLFLPEKNNYAALGEGFSFTFDGKILKWQGTTNITCKEAGAIDMPKTKTNCATEWLKDRLTGEGEVLASVIKDQAERDGITEKPLQTARENLGIKISRKGFSGQCYWSLKGKDAGDTDIDMDKELIF